MNIDRRVLKRFQQLVGKTDSLIKDAGYGDGYGDSVDNQEFTGWGLSVLDLLQRVFGENSLQCQHFAKSYERARYGSVVDAIDCISILKSAYEDYENGYLFDIRTLLKAELGGNLLDQALELHKGGQKNLACFVAGLALELAIKDLCDRQIPATLYDRRTKLDTLNHSLCKAKVYNLTKQKQIHAWIDLRNRAAHGEWDEYDFVQVKELIDSVRHFVEEYLS